MIKVEMANNNSLDVVDVVAGSLDGIWEFVIVGIFHAWEDICHRSRPFLRPG
jgi:hypothetical protein